MIRGGINIKQQIDYKKHNRMIEFLFSCTDTHANRVLDVKGRWLHFVRMSEDQETVSGMARCEDKMSKRIPVRMGCYCKSKVGAVSETIWGLRDSLQCSEKCGQNFFNWQPFVKMQIKTHILSVFSWRWFTYRHVTALLALIKICNWTCKIHRFPLTITLKLN